MVIEPLLAAPVLAFTVIVTVLLPVPLAGDTITQDGPDVVQAQLGLEAVIVTD